MDAPGLGPGLEPDRQAELYMARVLSETLESRECRSRTRSALVRPAVGAGGLSLGWSVGAGNRGFCRAILGHLRRSFKFPFLFGA